MVITKEDICRYEKWLIEEEKAASTVKKYTRDLEELRAWLDGRAAEKAPLLEYKERLKRRFSTSTVNTKIAAINSFVAFANAPELRLKSVREQRAVYTRGENELTRAEYERLLCAAAGRGDDRLYNVIRTICSTGIRVSELRWITVESLSARTAAVDCKGKRRRVFLPSELCAGLEEYAAKRGIISGSVFVTGSGRPLDRSNIWADMKRLCGEAGVPREKVYPHNLRHLFARVCYSAHKDIVRLADILGHSSVNTTRIYTTEAGSVHRRQVESLGLAAPL